MHGTGRGQMEAAWLDGPGRGTVLEAALAGDEVMELILAVAVSMPPSMPGDLVLVVEMVDKDDVIEAQLGPPARSLYRISILGIFSQNPIFTPQGNRTTITV